MTEDNLIKVTDEAKRTALIDNQKYLQEYQRSIKNPEEFWAEHGKRIDWIKPYTKIKDVSYAEQDLHIKWFYDGTLNVSSNCLDRHLETRADQAAIIWEGDDPNDDKKISFKELHAEVCKFANGLKELGVKRVTA